MKFCRKEYKFITVVNIWKTDANLDNTIN